MKNETKIFKPYVSLEQAFAYDERKPETRSGSPLVDAVVEALKTVRPLSTRRVGEYLGLNPKKISAALEIATGYDIKKFKEEWTKHRIKKMLELYPEMSSDELASEVGLADRSSLWRVYHRDKELNAIESKKQGRDFHVRLPREKKIVQLEELMRNSGFAEEAIAKYFKDYGWV